MINIIILLLSCTPREYDPVNIICDEYKTEYVFIHRIMTTRRKCIKEHIECSPEPGLAPEQCRAKYKIQE